ncbi:peptidase inhibitor family I36 protein [Streptomyces sp. NPDC001380]|uniref:peptidase inhibitor family I36 protein n=1 Tax=Streptomyces sp. NPDC001380 TaxID=3364566 RepID=UPI0036AF2939
MRGSRRMTGTALSAALLVLAPAPASHAADGGGTGGGVLADHDGRTIDLADGWDGASVCNEFPDRSVGCFDTTAEADAAVAAHDAAHPQPRTLRSGAGRAAAEAAGDGYGVGPVTTAPADPVPPGYARSTESCPASYVCLWQDAGYRGRMLRWSAPGTKRLQEWDFRDKASSACDLKAVGRGGLYDWRPLMPDPELLLPADACVKDFTKVGYRTGGSWNDRADALVV